ncbi:hypothetical protein KUW15_03065 [Qipengyuania aquimaris]|uniref:hypothetical protein n=1 Tax=Qipengyuania aquimaris TaxID=255984 RepID=UPI001C949A5F|nr:hypothetical protein [Qipengyuania aquimaris]MBY6127690.1 hypothetical protein [Qipengyuania aquimaris]
MKLAAAFERYMAARLEQDEALLNWMGSGEDAEAEPWQRAQAARVRRDSAANEYVSILMEDPFTAKAKYEGLRARLRRKCDQPTWEKMIEHLQALDKTFHAQYRRAFVNAVIRRYWLVLLVGIILGAPITAYLAT